MKVRFLLVIRLRFGNLPCFQMFAESHLNRPSTPSRDDGVRWGSVGIVCRSIRISFGKNI